MTMHSWRMGVVLSIVCGALGVVSPGAEPAGSKPSPMIPALDCFMFTNGVWAVYDVQDLRTNAHYKMWVAITERIQRRGKPAAWMELEVEMPGQPAVVTRFLTEETPGGPGEIYDVIVQVAGTAPFRVPKKYLKSGEKGAAQITPVIKKAEGGRETMEWKGRSLEVFKVDAIDDQDRPIKAIVSTAVPPLAVVKAETADARMELESWGGGATTRLHGTPRPMCLWIFELIGKSCVGLGPDLGEPASAPPAGP